MITCTLSDKQLRILRTKIAKDLLTYVDNKTPFDLKEYLTDIYNRVYGLTGNQNSAIDYARMSVPFIKQLWGVEEKFAELEDIGLDVRELGGLARLVSDNKDGFDETAAFLGVDTNPAVELAKTKEQLNIQEQIEKVQTALALGSSNTVYGLTRKPDSPLSTSIQELLDGKEINGADPRMKFYTNFTKEILTKLGVEGTKTPEQGISYKGVDGGLFLTLMRYNEIGVNDTYPHVSEVINSGVDRDYIIEDYNNAFIYAITDKQGNIVRFNEKYEVTEDGKVVYYNSRYLPNKNKDNAFDVDRVTNTQNPQEISKNFGISLDEARAYLKQGFEFLESAYDYIRAAKGNKIINTIDFGSFGAISDTEAKPIPYSGNYFGKQNLNFNFYAPGAVSKNSFGGIYVTPNETNSPVPIINKTLSDELVNNIVDLILDVNEDANGDIITNADKKKIIGTYVLSSVRDLSYGVDGATGEFFVKVQGEKIKLSNKVKAREELTKALKTNAKGMGREYVIDTAKANSNAVVPMVTIANNKATIKNVPYSEYLASFALVKVDLDVDGTIKQYNPYFKVAPINADTAKVIVESKDIISDKDYNNFVDNGIVSDIILDIIANKVINKEALSPREMAIFTGKTGEINEIIAKSSKVTSNEAKVAAYRAEEQKELLKAIPNIEKYKVDGKVDKSKLSEAELAAYEKIYDKYDKLISPLLGIKKETYNGIEVVDSSAIKATTGEPGAARYDRANNKILINREFLKKKFEEKAWTKSRKQKDGSFATALAEDAFATYDAFEKFVMEHEYQHSLLTYEQSGATTIGEYEDIINGRALNQKTKTTTENKPVINIYWRSPESSTNTKVLSNLAPRKFTWQGREYGSVEHAYQSNKSGAFDQATYDKYVNAGGYGTKIRGKAVTNGFDNLQLMRDLVVESFKQNPDKAALLLNYSNFTHTTNEVIDKAFLDGVRIAQKNAEQVGTKQTETTGAPQVQTISESYGVVVAETNPTAAKTQEFVNLIKPQIQLQAYKENASGTANDMFMYGLRWTRKNKAKAPLVNKSYANGGLPTTDAKAKDGYVYDTVDQNGKPLAPVSDLQPIIKEIEETLGIDMSNYDAVIGNIYLPGQNIATHRDTTESLSARKYPVVVYTIGNMSGIRIYENEKNPGSASFASDKRTTIPTQNGSIYTFGMDGRGRFELAHDTPTMNREQKFPPITLPNGTVVENYTITLTFRRAADLEPGMADSPTGSTAPAATEVVVKEATKQQAFRRRRTSADSDILDKLSSDDEFINKHKDKLKIQGNVKATREQIATALTWYQNSPLSKHIPFKVMFNAVNTATKNGIARWDVNGITLFKGSDYSDLYHEAWHGFTQMFLTETEREKLYSETRRQKGMFVAFSGNTVAFETATDEELEEYLAEDFREYMLGNKKGSVKTPVKKNIFQKIFDFLMELFGKARPEDILTNGGNSSYVNELYEKLRVGDLNQYTFNQANRVFTTLNSTRTVQSTTPQELRDPSKLSYEDSMLIGSTIDALFSQAIDRLSASGTKTFTTSVIRTVAGRSTAYKYAEQKLTESLYNALLDRNDMVEQGFDTQEIDYEIDLLSYALRHFGDPNNLANPTGVIKYHMNNSKFLQFEDRQLQELEGMDDSKLALKNEFEAKSGNESSAKALASPTLLYTIRSLYAYDKNGEVRLNKLGFPMLMDYNAAWNRIYNITDGARNVEDVFSMLSAASEDYPMIKQFLRKVGSPATMERSSQELWTEITHIMTMKRIPLVSLHMGLTNEYRQDEENEQEEITPGKSSIETTLSITPVRAGGEYRKVGSKWDNAFAVAPEGEFIVVSKDNINSLNIPAVMDKHSTLLSKKNLDGVFSFMEDIGMPMEDNATTRKAMLSAEDGTFKAIYDLHRHLKFGIHKYNNTVGAKNPIVITRPSQLFAKYKVNTSDSLLRNMLGGIAPKFTAIQKFQLKWSDDFSDTTVSNAEGENQYEKSLRGTLMNQVDSINRAETITDLTQEGVEGATDLSMNHLAKSRNPFMKSSKFMARLFNENGEKYIRKNEFGDIIKAEIELLNMSGASFETKSVKNIIERSGVAAANADAMTKTLQDFYMMMLYGVSEGTRHADKSTTYLYRLITPNLTSKQIEPLKHLITISDFAQKTPGGQSLGRIQFIKDLTQHLGSEYERIQKVQTEKVAGNALVGSKTYKQVGSEFVIFDKILDTTTKDALKAYAEKGISTQEQFLEALNDDVDLREKVESQIGKYLTSQVSEFNAELNKFGFYRNDALVNPLIDKMLGEGEYSNRITPARRQELIDSLAEAYVANSWEQNLETVLMFYGDPGLYNHAKDEFFKRNAGIGATGGIPRTDQYMQDYINARLSANSFASKFGYTPKKFGKTMVSAVLEDPITESVYYSDYVKSAKAFTEKRLKDRGASPEQIEKAVTDIVKRFGEYKKMTEGDGQGWINFDAYRSLLISLNKWTTTQESIYNKLVNGEEVTEDVLQFFPVKKMQYWGPLKTDGLPLYGFHKYSLMPLIPNLVKGKNIEKLQNKMLEQGVDYALLKSGSKLNTITANGTADKFYNDATSNRDKTLAIDSDDYKFTPNEIFMDYFKDQLEVHDHFNEKVTFSTQLRKLIEDGLMENGVPTDWRPEIKDATERVLAWKQALESGQEIDSKNYTKLLKYEANLARLVEIKKDQLRKEIGNNMEDLIAFVKRELTRQELAEHELTFIDYDGQTGELKNSLELSLSVDKIEKLLVGVVQKRLINQKINGEALVQVSGVGFEDANKNMRNATEKEIKQYGTNGLTFYEEILDENKNVIGTRAMKVKISLQGSFKNLLKRDDVLQKAQDEGVTPLDALNLLIKDDAWLKDGDNRAMVTMVAARIPVQGLNSMEFMEVFEFLPEESGNIVILPAEIVAKSGGDYDIDKMFTMMPNIKAVIKTVSDKTLEDLSEEMGRKVTRNEIKNVLKMVEFENPLSEEEQDIYNFIETFGTEQTTVSLAKGDNVKGIENALIADSVDILSMPENFINLITPNSTDILKPIANTMADMVRGEKEGTMKSPTEIFELGRNLYKHQANSVGKAVLGIIAVNNTFNTLFARTGLVMDTNRILTTDGKGEPVMMSQELYLPHNEIDKKISLSSAYSQDLSNRVADVINQMINGAVDVAKDAWIFDIQGNKEVIPSLLFLIQAGVPVKQAVYFVSQPIIRDYIELQKKLKSQFSVPAGFKDVGMFYRIEARNSILFDNDQFTTEPGSYLNDKGRYDKSKVFNLLRNYSSQPKLFTEKNLEDNMKSSGKEGYTDVDKAVFAHFVEIQEMAGQITQLTQALKFDNDKTSTLWDARMKLEKMETVSNGISRESIRKIAEESPISAFKIQDFIIEQYNRLFPLRDSQAMNYTLSYLYAKQKDGLVPIMGIKKKTGMDDETFQRAYRNDLMSFLFQQDYYDFSTNSTTYQGKDVTKDVREVTSLTSGVKVKGDKIYVDYASVKNLFESGAYSNQTQWETTAPVDTTVFDFYDETTGLKLYTKFLFERETLRSYPENSVDAIADTEEFKKYYNSFNTAESEPFRNKKAYEAVLRDRALDNLNYHGHMFYGERAYGRQVLSLKSKHPELFETYPMLKNLEAFTKPYGMTTITNVKFSNTLLSSDDLNVYHNNLQDLANPSVAKVADPVENEKISKIFQRFALFSMIQTGTDLKTTYSMVRALPTEMTTLLLEKPYNKFINMSVPEQQDVVNNYTGLFTNQYSKDNFLSKKIKNYTGDVTNQALVLGEGKNRIINLDPLAQIAVETEKTDVEGEGVSRTIEVGGLPINLDALGINFQPNAQQVEALNKMAEFINKGFDPTKAIEDNMYTLMGYAGTGKTSITKILLEYLNKANKSVDVTATTHKAKGVLAQAINKRTKTIHTVLSLAPNIDPARVDLEKLKMSPAKDDQLIPSDVIIIDESSFIGPDLFQFIKDKADRDEQQVIFIGDPAQIKPVAPNSDSDEVTLKENSPVFKEVSNVSELTQVERQATGNPLGPILDSLRNNLFATKDSFAHRTELNGNEGIVFNDSGKAFISAAVDAFRSDNFKANRNFTRIITYVNERVPKYNEAIRKGLGYTEEYVPGEILMGYDNYRRQKNGEYDINNSVDYVVLSAEYVEDQPIAKNIVGAAGLQPYSGSGYKLVIQDISDKRAKPVEIFMLSKNNEDSLYDNLGEQAQKLASLAKTDNSLWKYYYAFKESFGTDRAIKDQGRTVIKKTLDYGYAHTIHKSQGATYTNIFVDLGSISISQDVEERNQMKYVALSRATNIAYALSGNAEGVAPELDWNMDFGKQVPVNGAVSSSYKTADDITTLSQITLIEDPRTGIRTFKYALEKKDGTSQPMTGILTDETMAAFKLDYPNALILHNESSDGKGGTAGTNAVWRSLGTNAIGLPTKKGTRPTSVGANVVNMADALTDETLDENKKLIDEAIANIKTAMAKPNRFIVFDQYGYGQYMVGYPENRPLVKTPKFAPVAKQTFLYLSEQLFRNFGYVNPHYLEFAEGRKVVQKDQPVSDDDVIEQNKIC